MVSSQIAAASSSLPSSWIASRWPVIRPRSMRSAEITRYKADLPGLNAPGVRFVIASFPLTDGARPSRDVKTMIARFIVGAIRTYSRGAHHDRKHCCTTSQQTGGQGCDSPVSGEFSGSRTYRIAQAYKRDKVAARVHQECTKKSLPH